jgi:hypothetical protein
MLVVMNTIIEDMISIRMEEKGLLGDSVAFFCIRSRFNSGWMGQFIHSQRWIVITTHQIPHGCEKSIHRMLCN